MENIENFEKKLKKALVDAGLSQTEFAARLGLKKQQISRWARGEAFPRGETLVKIAQALGVPMSYFVGEDNAVSQQANGNAGSVSQSVSVGGGDVGAKLEIMNVKLDLIVEMLRNMKK